MSTSRLENFAPGLLRNFQSSFNLDHANRVVAETMSLHHCEMVYYEIKCLSKRKAIGYFVIVECNIKLFCHNSIVMSSKNGRKFVFHLLDALCSISKIGLITINLRVSSLSDPYQQAIFDNDVIYCEVSNAFFFLFLNFLRHAATATFKFLCNISALASQSHWKRLLLSSLIVWLFKTIFEYISVSHTFENTGNSNMSTDIRILHIPDCLGQAFASVFFNYKKRLLTTHPRWSSG